MWGRATLATEVSRTSMKVPSMTAMVISQGWAGRGSAWDKVGVDRSLAMGHLVRGCDDGDDAHAGAKGLAVGGDFVEDDFDGNALHDFDVVASRVFRRQETESGSGALLDGIDVTFELHAGI